MYSFSVYSSPLPFPMIFAIHTWVVLESPEFGIKRYEIHAFKNKKTENYFYINAQDPHRGIPMFFVPCLYVEKKVCI